MIVLFIVISVNLKAQIDKTFWFAAPDITSGHGDFPTRFVITAFDKPVTLNNFSQPANPLFSLGGTNVTLKITAGGSTSTFNYVSNVPITIPANGALTIEFSSNLGPNNNIESVGSGNSGNSGISNTGFLIQTSELVSIYYEIEGGFGPFNADLFSLKGQNALGTEFILTTQKTGGVNTIFYNPQPYNRAYVIATENNTFITIKASVNLVGGPTAGNTSGPILLQKGEVYVISAAGFNGTDHLGGTIVKSDKPVAITMSDDSVELPAVDNGSFSGGIDLNGDQLVPTRLAGKLFITLPGNLGGTPSNPGSNGPNDYVYVYPVKNATTLKVNGVSYGISKNQGDFWEIKNGTSSASGSTLVIEASDSVLVYQLNGNLREVGGAVIPQINCSGSQRVSVFRGGLPWHNFSLIFYVKLLMYQISPFR